MRQATASIAQTSNVDLTADLATFNDTVSLALGKSMREMHKALTRKLKALSRSVTPVSVHGARTSARRLGAVLSGYKRLFRTVSRHQYLAALREVTQSLDALRDADVMRQTLTAMARRADASKTEENDELLAQANRNRSLRLFDLESDIRSDQWVSRLARLQRAASDPLLILDSQKSPAAAALRVLKRRRRRLRSALGYRGRAPRRLHRLRGKIRTLRYLLEHTQSLGLPTSRFELNQLRKLQDCLGTLHDAWLASRALTKGHCHQHAVAELSKKLKAQQTHLLAVYDKKRSVLRRLWRDS